MVEAMLASALARDLDRVVEAACARLRPIAPHLWDDVVADGVRTTVRASLDTFLRAWSEGRPLDADELASVTTRLDRFDGRVPRSLLVRAHRVTVDVVRDHIERCVSALGTQVATAPGDVMAMLRELGVARSLERQLTAAVEAAVTAREQAEAAQRGRLEADVVAALLDVPTDPTAARGALLALGLPVAGPWTVALLPASRDRSEARTAFRERGLSNVVAVARPEGVVVLAAETPAAVAAAVAAEEAAGIGTRAETLSDVRTSAETAVSALEVSVARRCGPVRSDGAELDLLLIGAVTTAELVERTLAPLAGVDGDRRTWMLETLDAYLDAGCSVTAAARALSLHRESVRYRVTQLRELLGSDLDEPDRRLALHLAVKAIRHGLAPAGGATR